MKFGSVPVLQAVGAVSAHTVRAGDLIIRKGVVITAMDVERCAAVGVEHIVCARLDPGDLGENDAARHLAEQVAGKYLRHEAPFTGRANLFAASAGLLLLDHAAIDRFNAVDEAITIATLPAYRMVEDGEMVATIKVIPYGLPAESVARALAAMGDTPPLSVRPFKPKRVAMLSTLLPGLKPAVIDKTLQVMARRLKPSGSEISVDRRVAHHADQLAGQLRQAASEDHDIIIVFGASAITDRRDVIPMALELAGGMVKHLGMPVDPGNLLMLGELQGKPVIGAPGCARSPKENGFDWILQRFLADVPVNRRDIQQLGVGGLLMEIVSRPQPRAPGHVSTVPPLAAIVLAAGRSSRMGEGNKLRELVHGEALVRHAVKAALAARIACVLVVTGHDSAAIRAELTGLDVTFVDNPEYALGLSTSLRAGIAAVPPDAAGALVLLADMPNVTPAILDRLIDQFSDASDAQAVVPTVLGQRGNPVLLARGLFPAIDGLVGDSGARKLLDQAGDAVIEVAIDDPAIALDIDTPEALAAYRGLTGATGG